MISLDSSQIVPSHSKVTFKMADTWWAYGQEQFCYFAASAVASLTKPYPQHVA